jgi:hypothetical protein
MEDRQSRQVDRGDPLGEALTSWSSYRATATTARGRDPSLPLLGTGREARLPIVGAVARDLHATSPGPGPSVTWLDTSVGVSSRRRLSSSGWRGRARRSCPTLVDVDPGPQFAHLGGFLARLGDVWRRFFAAISMLGWSSPRGRGRRGCHRRGLARSGPATPLRRPRRR